VCTACATRSAETEPNGEASHTRLDVEHEPHNGWPASDDYRIARGKDGDRRCLPRDVG